ncbi:hypothetical protein HK096_000344 [Nowakowskiella sp. JEL0078]|nr:hypothetical protein HK096_000344 [Nowakowskiella sp. JEL0078]
MKEIQITPNLRAEPVSINTIKGSHYLSNFPQFNGNPPTCGVIISGTINSNTTFVPSENGFIYGVLQAYNHHHNLIIRPDDIWIAILIQFSRFVEAQSESLRDKFVSHSGTKELEVIHGGTLETADFDKFSDDMVDKLRNNVVDETLTDWVIPDFTTNTKNDVIVGSVVFMASMKKYFTYKFTLCCGIPALKIDGCKEDWESILSRVAKLKNYGKECEIWVDNMLTPILMNFCSAFDSPPNLEFWQRICHHTSTGSGPSYISGWISAFCVFDDDGKWRGDQITVKTWTGALIKNDSFPVIDISGIQSGFVTVDLKIDDNGNELESLMFSGHTGFEVVDKTWIAPKLSWTVAKKN